MLDTLAALDESISNNDLVTTVLNGPIPKFDMIVTNIESLDSVPHFSTLQACLLNFEAR